MKSINHVNINSKNPFDLIFNNVDGYVEESNGNKYLVFTSTGKNKEVLKKYIELRTDFKNQIETINGTKSIGYKIYFINIRFKSDDDLLFDEMLSIPGMILVVGSVLQEYNKYYSQVMCVYICG